MASDTKVEVPYRLSWDGRGGYKPGRGEAGWTARSFDSLEAAKTFMRENPEAEMPCWRRIEARS
jgi:hypothetical protein